MRFLSLVLTLGILLLALCFALNNHEATKVSLWPFGFELTAPLFVLTLGALFFGLFFGITIGWINHWPHRIEARRLRRHVADLRGKMDELETAITEKSATEGEDEGEEDRAVSAKPKTSFWRRGSKGS